MFGVPLAISNVYVGLKTGWVFGVALTAAWLAHLLSRALRRVHLTPLSTLEINCAQSTASSAGFATGNALVGAVPAVLLLGGPVSFSAPSLVAWVAMCSLFGVALAWIVHAPFVNAPELPFPSATAAATMLTSTDQSSARVLLPALVVSSVLTLLRDALRWIPTTLLGVEVSALMLGAGALVGLKTCAWLVVGGAITASALPKDMGVWVGAPLLVVYSALSVLPRARGWFDRAMTTVEQGATSKERAGAILVMLASGAALAVIGHSLFGVPLVLSALALVLSIGFCFVSIRAVGETDVAPGGALSKLTQLATAAVWPQLPIATVMTGALTHAAATASADCVNDLKCGRLLGASARQQVLAQALGILPGALASVAAFYILVPDASVITSGAVTAPAAHQLKAVALVMQHGLASLSALARTCVAVGAALGALLFVLERMRLRVSAVGLGLGLFLPLAGSITMLLGAFAGAWLNKRKPGAVLPASAGVMLGESVCGIAVALVSQMVR